MYVGGVGSVLQHTGRGGREDVAGRRDENEREITATVKVNTEWVDEKTQRRQERKKKLKRQK